MALHGLGCSIWPTVLKKVRWCLEDCHYLRNRVLGVAPEGLEDLCSCVLFGLRRLPRSASAGLRGRGWCLSAPTALPAES